ncbi:choice-of-anchor R domain-containing protein [Anabaena sp. UHCC 0451]|uniref:choice-of-anchor R domain-containing protein n=1 Tax=Anabaena sp. UHCC 0451 TaxID=2055235 RepID=UPI002B20C15B|nr:choice-of-anchor R domain-containing protein [Anabaena sp. UHCC 0451]MEA5576496.1 choice-of-anchor R domain-containing protein [Anabaena sp. UHCC 0451]
MLAFSSSAQALTTLWGNYSSTNDGGSISMFPTTSIAVGFTLPTGSNYTLNSIDFRLRNYNTSTGDVALIQIYRDSGKTSSNPLGATLESVTFNNPNSSSDAVGNFNFIPTTTFTFLADTRYWLLVNASAGDDNWMRNQPSVTPTGISGMTSNGYQLTANTGSTYAPWTLQYSFQINATEVPSTPVPFEFSHQASLAILGGAWLVRRGLKKKSAGKILVKSVNS